MAKFYRPRAEMVYKYSHNRPYKVVNNRSDKTGSVNIFGKYSYKTTQADRVIYKFGGPRNMYRLLKSLGPEFSMHPCTIYRWTYPKGVNLGTGGVIPVNAMLKIAKAARLLGIRLEPEDFYPGPA